MVKGENGKKLNTADSDALLPTYSMTDVKWHNVEEDGLWIILYNRIYDVSEFLNFHPGGPDVLEDLDSDPDGTSKFEEAFHSIRARDMCKKYLKGKLRGSELGDLHQPATHFDESERCSRLNIVVAVFVVAVAYAYLKWR